MTWFGVWRLLVVSLFANVAFFATCVLGMAQTEHVLRIEKFSLNRSAAGDSVQILLSGARGIKSNFQLSVLGGGNVSLTVPIAESGSNPLVRVQAWLQIMNDEKRVIQIEYYPGLPVRAASGKLAKGMVQIVSDLPRGAQSVGFLDTPRILGGAPSNWQIAGLPIALSNLTTKSSSNPNYKLASLREPKSEEFEGRLALFLNFIHGSGGLLRACTSAVGMSILKEMNEQSCFVGCSGYSVMLRDYLRMSGIPARVIVLTPRQLVLADNRILQYSEGHTTVEAYVEGRWILIEPTVKALRFIDVDGHPMGTAELISAYWHPKTRGSIRVRQVGEDGSLSTVSLKQAKPRIRELLRRYLTQDKSIAIAFDGRG
jgi:hypothetical protein